MNSAAFQRYRHSGKFGAHGPLLALAFAMVAGFPLGYAYAYLTQWIPFIYFNVIATFGYGVVFGVVCGKLMKYALVRNNAIALLTGFAAGLIVLYLAWNGHVHSTFQDAPIFCSPREIYYAAQQLYEHGSWGLHSDAPLTGVLLGIVWLVEAGIIVGFCTLVSYNVVAEVPFCETTGCWLDQTKRIDTLAPFTDSAQLAAFKAGDLGPLTQAQPRPENAGKWTRILLKHSPRCQIFHTVRLQHITLEFDKKGKAKTQAKNLTGDLILPADMLGLITKFEQFGAPAEVPAAPES